MRRAATRPAFRPAGPQSGHYPWSLEAQRAEARSRHGGFLRLLYNGLRAILLMPVRPANLNPGAGSCLAAGRADHADRRRRRMVAGRGAGRPLQLERAAQRLVRPADHPARRRVARADRAARACSRRKRVPIISAMPTPLLHFAAVMLSASAWIVAIAFGLFIAISAGAAARAVSASRSATGFSSPRRCGRTSSPCAPSSPCTGPRRSRSSAGSSCWCCSPPPPRGASSSRRNPIGRSRRSGARSTT